MVANQSKVVFQFRMRGAMSTTARFRGYPAPRHVLGALHNEPPQLGASMRMIDHEVARAERARQREQTRHEAATLRALRNAERQAKADAIAAQIEEADD